MDDDRPTKRADQRLDTTKAQSRSTDAADRMIGPYRLLDKLGEGGMGEVWLARQTEPVKRNVALKIIKQGMDTRQVVARFEAERQALAMMDHPAIAKVYDAGATPRGRPYFAMEYVQGVPITEHCDRQRLSNRQRLDLFLQVCDGVQHAHHKAVIHRDLKPSNVLVSIRDGKPVPKIIDFGVAKATAQKLTEETLHTQLGVLIGTPAYMSPEQAELTSQDIDTRTDVYALGVMLYELLVGALPFDLKEFHQAGLQAMVRKIREDEPPRPSTRLSTLGEHSTQSAKKRRTELPALKRQLSGDLDWITLKALEKDRTRRYGSPQELAADIERHLNDQPVLASPPSTAYRARKFVRRNRLAVTAAATVTVVLFAGVVGTTVGFVRARRAEAQAQREARAAERVSSLLEEMLRDVDPRRFGDALRADLAERVAASGEHDRARAFEESLRQVNLTDAAQRLLHEEILGRAASTIENELGGEPLIAARLHHSLGAAYFDLGLLELSEEHHRKAANIFARERGENDPDALHNLEDIATIYRKSQRYAEAEELLHSLWQARRRTLGERDPRTLVSRIELGDTYRYQGRHKDAEELLSAALADARRALGDDDYQTVIAMNNLALAYQEQGRLEEAGEMFSEAVERFRRTRGPEDVETLNTTGNLGITLNRQGRHEEAARLMNEVVDAYRRKFGEEHWRTLEASLELAEVQEGRGRFEQAETLLLAVYERRKRLDGAGHPKTLEAGTMLSRMLRLEGRLDEAEPLQLELETTCRRAQPEDGLSLAAILEELGATRTAAGRFEDAEPPLREALRIQRDLLDPEDWRIPQARSVLGESLGGQGRFEEAERVLIEAFESMGPAAPALNRARARERVRALYEAWERPDRAAGWR